MDFAAQSPYPGRQNVANSRDVMRNPAKIYKFFKNFSKTTVEPQ
jgi:hypothetical protein